MTRRIVSVLAVLLVAGAAALALGAKDDDGGGKTYKLHFDNAFGLTEGGDFKVAGVRAGKTSKFKVVKEDDRPVAEVTAEVTEPGFDDLRVDATCEIRPQSLIGEYYVDCQPGEAAQRLPKHGSGQVPVEQTASTIPQDTVNNILRRPYRERLRIILTELGTALAGRPEDLNAALRRAHPGLRETSRVLRLLGDQNRTLEAFIRDADTVVAALEENKRDVTRFVSEAGEAAEVSASRREELRRTLERLPRFLAELEPTMNRLSAVADEQTPLLSDLRRAAPDLDRFIEELGPLAKGTRPALGTLGEAARTGRRAFQSGRHEVAELERLAEDAPGTFEPLRQFLQTSDDRRRAIDDDERGKVNGPPETDRSHAGGRGGFTAMESLWNYFYWQTLAINGFDPVGHVLRVGVTVTKCTPFQNLATIRQNEASDPNFLEDCNQWLGPDQPGLTTPDFTAPGGAAGARTAAARPTRERGERRGPGEADAEPLPGQPDISRPQVALPDGVQQLLDDLGGGLEQLGGDTRSAQPDPATLLDFLLAP